MKKNNGSPHPLRIALTGGLGCGKTTVAQLLQNLGAAVWDADEAVHRQLRPGTPAYRRIVKTFGPQMVRASGGICRIALAAVAFTDLRRRRSLENILHPAVIREMRVWLSLQRQKKQPAVVVVPLLFEAGLQRGWDYVVCVAADEKIALPRLRRRGIDATAARRRMAAQWPLDRKVRRADVVIWNNGARRALAAQVKKFWAMHQKEK